MDFQRLITRNSFVKKNEKIYVAGHRGLVGSAIIRCLNSHGYKNLVVRDHTELDLEDNGAVEAFFETEKPDYVFLAAAKVGGILANNTYPADFIYRNLTIQNHVIHHSYRHGVKKLLFLGSSCIYPRHCSQPIKESYLMTGALEPTNSPYAVAKIAGIEMCWAYNRQYGTQFIPVMPTNLYGPNDNFDSETSHVLPALIQKFHQAKVKGDDSVEVWGSGQPRREFIYVEDMADACVHVMTQPVSRLENYPKSLINVGTGVDISIKELAHLIRDIVGLNAKIVWDSSKPDGTPQKLLDVAQMCRMGWEATTDLEKGIRDTYGWYLDHMTSN